MVNAYLYTFATIAATFGSAVGIVVAATVFRLQRIDQIAATLAKHLADSRAKNADSTRLYRIIDVQHWTKFVTVWREIYPTKESMADKNDQHYYWLLCKVNRRHFLIRWLAFILVLFTLPLIAISIVALAHAEAWVKDGAAMPIALWRSMGIACALLVGYLPLGWLLLKSHDYDRWLDEKD